MADLFCCIWSKKTKDPLDAHSTNQNRPFPTPNPGTGEQQTGAQSLPAAQNDRVFQINYAEFGEQTTHTGRISRERLLNTKMFDYRELATATNNFHLSTVLGQGGFGCVYKGTLVTGEVVAVKKLNPMGKQGNKEFMVEVIMLALLRHPNLLTMLGYCAVNRERILVLEYMPFGSLDYHLHDLTPDMKPLDWNKRMQIAAGVARGMEYLHHEADPPVIFRDLKPSNILLDKNYHPKLSDFGLAKFGPRGDKTHVSTRVMGTYGYCAPEYAITGKLTLKSDIFSFGILLLVIISGRKAIDNNRPKPEVVLYNWVLPLLNDQNNYAQLADPKLNGHYRKDELRKAIIVSAMCLNENANNRPTMKEVVSAMEFISRKGEATSHKRRSSPSRDHTGGSGLGLSPAKSPKLSLDDGNRGKAVADAKEWGKECKEKQQQGGGSSSANA